MHRLQQAGLVEVVSNDLEAQIVPIRRPSRRAAELPPPTLERDPAARHGPAPPHRTAPSRRSAHAHIGDAIAGALADAARPPPRHAPPLAALDPATSPTAEALAARTRHQLGRVPPGRRRQRPAPRLPSSPPRSTIRGPADPNAAWLADLYAQFIDEPEAWRPAAARRSAAATPRPLDVAFKADEQDGEAKVSTLKRLMGALKKLTLDSTRSLVPRLRLARLAQRTVDRRDRAPLRPLRRTAGCP